MIATRLRARNGKQCRERWRNHLRPQLTKGEWTAEEDQEIWDRVGELGTKWAQISEQYMPSRTDNDIKNRWNSIIRKAHAPGHLRPNSARDAIKLGPDNGAGMKATPGLFRRSVKPDRGVRLAPRAHGRKSPTLQDRVMGPA